MTVASLTESRLHVIPIDSAGALADMRAEWKNLDRGNVFCGWEWLDSWWQQYRQTHMQLFTLALRDEAGELVGLAPWYLSHTPGQGRVVRFLGSGEVCSDYLTILARPGAEQSVADALADWLCDQADHEWDLVELTGLAAGSKALDFFRKRLESRGYRVHEQPDVNCWRLTLPQSWDEYLSRLSKSRRAHIRALARRNFDTGRATVKQVGTAAELERGFEILIDLHQKRRASLSQAGCFASPQFTGFHREVAQRMLAGGRLRLLWIELEGRPVAIEYGFAAGGGVYYYQGGFEPASASECPGTLMCMASLKLAIEEGRAWFDFLRGDEPYKMSWRAEATPLRQMRVVARRPSARARHAAWRTGETIKRWAKQGLNMAEAWKSEALRVAEAHKIAAGNETNSSSVKIND
jgi:CelD/BcsL family acetyltransferase involved in cellulose biosynthesis